MKKFFLLSMVFLPTFIGASAFRQIGLDVSRAALSSVASLSKTMSGLYKAGVQLQSYRHLTGQDMHLLKGCHRLNEYSPVIGSLPFYKLQRSFLLEDWYVKENSLQGLVKHFFYKNPADGEIAITRYDKKKIVALPPTLIADLLKASASGTVLTQEQKDTHIKEWFKRYHCPCFSPSELPDEKNFRKRAKQFLNTYERLSEKLSHNQRSFVLLSVLFKVAQDRKDICSFARSFNVDLDLEDSYTKTDFEKINHAIESRNIDSFKDTQTNGCFLEQFFFWYAKRFNFTDLKDIPVYPEELLAVPQIDLSYKNASVVPLCVEETVRAVVQCFLFDHSTKSFTFTLLPDEIQQACKTNNPDFYAFIQKYNNPLERDYYKKSAQEWLALLSEIPNIDYMSKNFEMVGNAQVLKVICYLLGIPAVATYRELAEKISTDQRVVFLDYTKNYSESLLETDAITLKIEINDKVVEIGTAYFNWQHSFFKFCKTSLDSYKAKLSQDMYCSLLKEGQTEYFALRCSDTATMSLEQIKKYVDALSPVQLKDFLYTDFLRLKRLDVVAYIFEKAVKIIPDFNGNAFVSFALQSVDEPVAAFLLAQDKAPLDIFYKTILKETYLHKACENKKLSQSFIQKIIARYPQSIHLKDASNRTPLLLALRAKKYAVADFLLEQGAEFAVFTTDGDRLWSSCAPWEM